MFLHGAMHQLKRIAMYDAFVRKQHVVMFATDIAARGLGKVYVVVSIGIIKHYCLDDRWPS